MATVVNIRFGGDASGLTGALGSVSSALGTMRDKLNNAGTSISQAGQQLTSSISMPLINAGIDMFKLAANAEAMQGKLDVVMGEAGRAITEFSKTSAGTFGISRRAALEWGSTFGDIFKQAGIAPDVLADTSVEFLQLASDAQAFTDVPMEEVFVALSAGLRGETEPLARLGLKFNEAEVKAKGLAMGLGQGTGELNEQEKVLARHALILEKGARFQGQFAREAEGASGQMAIMNAKFEDAKVSLGEKLLPIGTKIVGMLTGFIDKFTALDEGTQKVILVVGGLVAALGPLLIGLGFAIKAVALLMSPITLVIAAIAALAFGIWWLYNNNERFRSGVQKVWEWIQANVIPAAKKFAEAHVAAFKAAVEWIQQNWPKMQAKIEEFVTFVQNEVIPRVQDFAGKVQNVLGALIGWVQTNWPKIQEAVTHVFNAIMTVVGPILAVLVGIIQFALTTIQNAWDMWGDNIMAIVKMIWDWIYMTIETTINLIRGIIEFVLNLINGDWGEAWNSLVEIVTTIWNYITSLIGTSIGIAWEVIKGGLELIWGYWQWLWNTITGFLGGVWNTITSLVSGGIDMVVGFIAGLPGRIADFVSGAFDSLKNGFASAINWIIEKWNNFRLGPWDLPSIDTPMGTIGGQRIEFNTPNIPYLAKGGNIMQGGRVVVGEKGPELLDLPRGARVTPLGREGGGIVIHVHGSVVSERELVSFVRDELNRTARRNNSVGFL